MVDFEAVNFGGTAYLNFEELNKLSFRLSGFTRLFGVDSILFIQAIKNANPAYYKSYAFLKQAMSNQHQHAEELQFFAAEMDAKSKNKEIAKSEQIIIRLYGIFSGYGLSAAKPFMWLVATGLLFWCIYCLCYQFNYGDSLTLSLNKSVPFLPQDKLSYLVFEKYTQYYNMSSETKKSFFIVTKAQIFFSLIFIFLIGLGFRNKLRL